MDDLLKKVDALNDVLDPDEEPFRSKYAARALLVARRAQLGGAEDARARALIDHRLGVNYVDTEELGRADDCLLGALATLCPSNLPYDASDPGLEESKDDCVPVLPSAGGVAPDGEEDAVFDTADDVALDAPWVYAVVGSLNHLGVLWSHRGEHARAKACLSKARAAYLRCLALHPGRTPPAPPALDAAPDAESDEYDDELESLHTHTCFYLAQVHANLGDAMLASLYCERTLERQAASGPVDREWVRNCVGLADFHLGAGAMAAALRCVEVSEFQLARLCAARDGAAGEAKESRSANDAAPPLVPEVDEYDGADDSLAMLDADIARRRAAVYVSVLNDARDVLIGHGTATEEASDAAVAPFSCVDATRARGGVEPHFDAGAYARSAAALDPRRARSFDDARALFREATAALDRAGRYYVIEGFVTEFIEIKQNTSKLYNYLSAFETVPKRRFAMAKRRLAIIGPLLGELNARVYTGIVRQLAFELGEISNTLLELKRGLIEAKLAARDSGAATPAEQFALNQLAIGGVRYFEYFVRTFADKGGVATAGPNALPFDADAAVGSAPLLPVASVVVEDDECRVYLVAYFQAARLYGKLFDLLPTSAVRAQRVHALRASLLRYEWLASYARRWPERVGEFRDELNIAVEMASLLPTQINRLHHG